MMSLSERIAERARDKAAITPHSNRAVVLALRSDIQQAITDGWSILAIYQTLHDEGGVTFSYQAFRRHVNRLLLGKSDADGRKASRLSKAKSVRAAALSSGFTFDPVADKEDLL